MGPSSIGSECGRGTTSAPRPDDLLQERLYCIQWMRPNGLARSTFEYEFRTVTEADLERESEVVERYVTEHLAEWQTKGWIPEMQDRRGWTTTVPRPGPSFAHAAGLIGNTCLQSPTVTRRGADQPPAVRRA